MVEHSEETQTAIWRVPESPFSIEYSLAVLDEIRSKAVDAFYSFRRGGAEIGGVLFGTREKKSVRILAFQQIRCEYAMGPTFILSDNDMSRLADLLENYRNEPDLADLEVVGWYHSHTRSEIFLSDRDLEIYRRFFPEPWQIALVLRPVSRQPTRAGFFFRERDGKMRTASSYQEFVIAPFGRTPGAKEAAEPRIEEPSFEPATAPPQEPVPEPEALDPTPVRADDPFPEQFATEAPPAPMIPRFLAGEPVRRRHPWIWLTSLLALGVGAAAYVTRDHWLPQSSAQSGRANAAQAELAPPVGLEAIDIGNSLILRWDRKAQAVRDAQGATLEITDGGSKIPMQWSARQLQSGLFSYARQSEKVDFHLILHQPDGRDSEEFTTFLGKLPARRPSKDEVEAKRQRWILTREVDRLKKDLRLQTTRNQQLQQALEHMRVLLRHEIEKNKKD